MNIKILVVEDNPQDTEKVKDVLKDLPYDLTCVSDGRSAIAFLSQQIPDLIIMDIVLPDVNGFEVCRQIRRDKQFDTVPVLFHSRIEDTTEKVIGIEMGFCDFVTKTADPREFICRINGLLHTRQMMSGAINFAVIDADTNVYTRVYFLNRLRDEFERSRRYLNNFCLAIVSIDELRKARTVFGNEVCLQIIDKVAEIIRRNVRRADILCRYDYGEFGWLLPESTAEEAMQALERVRKCVEKSGIYRAASVDYFTVSCAVGMYQKNFNSIEDLICKTEQILNQARASGGNKTLVSEQKKV